MLKQLFELIIQKLDEREKNGSNIDNRVLEIVEEIGKLEIELADKLHDAERWGDITDNSNWRTAEVNKLKRVIQAKEKMIETLKN